MQLFENEHHFADATKYGRRLVDIARTPNRIDDGYLTFRNVAVGTWL